MRGREAEREKCNRKINKTTINTNEINRIQELKEENNKRQLV